jgi:hypothetical protein
MKSTVAKWGTKAAGAGAIALLLASPSFAQSQGDYNRNGRGTQASSASNDDRDNRSRGNGYRENQRVTIAGQVSSFSRERDGYRVQLDRGGQSFWVPQSTFGNRARDLRSGVSISLGGVFRGGTIYVDAVSWPGQNDRGAYRNRSDNGIVRGVVDRVDRRSGTLWLRDDSSGRVIAVDMTAAGQYGRSGLRDLRRGQYVELTGQWTRQGDFHVARIDNIRARR